MMICNPMKAVPVIGLVLSALLSCSGPRPAERLLDELDVTLSRAADYQQRKEDRLEVLRGVFQSSRDPLTKADVALELGNTYFSYRYDSALYYLNRSLDLAEEVEDWSRFNAAAVRQGHLDAKAGHFMEAYSTLSGLVDTTLLSVEGKIDYFYALYDFSQDLESNAVVLDGLPLPDRQACARRILALAAPDSEAARIVKINRLLEESRLEEAENAALELAGTVAPEDRRFARYAYILSDISWRRGNEDRQLEWLVRSAQCDLENAVKDYASLTVIAQMMTGRDMDRAFRYMRIAQDDAIFYNGMLRPWQMSQSFAIIQKAYEDNQRKTARLAGVVAALLLALAITLLTAFRLLSKRSRKLTKMQKELKESNLQLEQRNRELHGLNQEISEAGRIKEVYIGRVLDMMSENVNKMQAYDNHVRLALKQGKTEQLLKELSISTRTDDELQAFYRTFDTTFLALYPHFIEDFNALLREEARIYPKKGEMLCTELRIFALIRLGIEDSVRIASLLHYSVSTIYNYKVKVKNGAAGDRDTFEEQVKRLGNSY